MNKSMHSLLLMTALCIGILLCAAEPSYGSDFKVGQSLVAPDQVKAGEGLVYPGLEITWLDLGEEYIRYYSSEPNQFAEGIFSLPISDGTLLINTDGTVIAAGSYGEVSAFSEGVAAVRKQRPWKADSDWQPGQLVAPPGFQIGYIDRTGKEVIPLGTFSGLYSDFHEGLAVLGSDGENKGFIDREGQIIIPQVYEDARDFSGDLAPVKSTDTKLWGYINKLGTLVIPMEYEKAESFHDGVAYVIKNGFAGYIDATGKEVIPFQYQTKKSDPSDRSFYNGLALATGADGKFGYIDKTGSFVIPPKYLEAAPFTGEVAFVTSENQAYSNGYGSSYLINRQGERLTPLWSYGFHSGETMQDGLFRVLYPYGGSADQSFVMLNQYGAEVISTDSKIKLMTPFNDGYALLLGVNNAGKTVVGLAKIPENVDEKKNGRLIKLVIDGKLLDFTDTDPIIENSRTLVPLKEIFEQLGAEVGWDPSTYTVSGKKDGTTVALKIGESKASINGKTTSIDTPAIIRNSRTMVPVRFIAESFDAEVAWDAATRTISIN
ncbi:MAG: hypothetical protein K0Q48_3591, partial [Bacillota bacterium]|nr:hypothetical protein [Bacillota bacterium]